MNAGTAAGLARGDLANLRRDPMLLGAALAPLLITALLRFGIPLAESRCQPVAELDPFLPVVLGVALLLVPLLVGFVTGFLLLEEREDRVLEAIEVSPVGAPGFLAYRLTIPGVLGVAAAWVVGLASGLATLPPLQLAGLTLLSGGSAMLTTMALAAFARDRVQGLALAKVLGFAVLGALAFHLLPDPWRWLLAPLPQSWVVEAAATTGAVWPVLGTGAALHAVAGMMLWRRLGRLLSGRIG